MGRPKGSRNYTQAEVIDFTDKAAMLGTLNLAAERLRPSRSSLRRWLMWRGYRIQQGRILDPLPGKEEPVADGAA